MESILKTVNVFCERMERKVVDFMTLLEVEEEVMKRNKLLLKKIKSRDFISSRSINFDFEVDDVKYTSAIKFYYLTNNRDNAEYTIMNSEECVVHSSRHYDQHIQGNWVWANQGLFPILYWDKDLEGWYPHLW